MTLWELKRYEKAFIKGFSEKMPEAYAIRLRELGFDQGVSISCERIAILGGPRTYQLGDSIFSLDKDIGSLVEVEG